MRKLLRISHGEHKTKGFLRSMVSTLVALRDPLLASVKVVHVSLPDTCRKLSFKVLLKSVNPVVARGKTGFKREGGD